MGIYERKDVLSSFFFVFFLKKKTRIICLLGLLNGLQKFGNSTQFLFTLTRFYADDGEDIVLIYSKRNDKFYALGAVCSHEGIPIHKIHN